MYIFNIKKLFDLQLYIVNVNNSEISYIEVKEDEGCL